MDGRDDLQESDEFTGIAIQRMQLRSAASQRAAEHQEQGGEMIQGWK
jgi:hypothetical protein